MRFSIASRQVLSQLRNIRPTVDVEHLKNEYVYKKFTALNNWYTKIIGLDEVKLYQDRVVNLQEKLLAAQEKRREVAQSLTEIRMKSNNLQEQLHKVKRQDDLQRFLELMKEETEVLKMEQDISRQIAECDREEREIFTAFTNAIRDSHEKQRAQIEYSKYLSLILSLAGSFLVFVYSSLRKDDLKRFILANVTNLSSTTLPTLSELQKNQSKLNDVVRRLDKDNSKLLKLVAGIHQEISNKNRNNDSYFGQSGFRVVDSGNDETIQKILKYGGIAFVTLLILRAMS